MNEPNTFRARQVLRQIPRPLSAAEIGPLMGATRQQADRAVQALVVFGLARRVSVRPARYEIT